MEDLGTISINIKDNGGGGSVAAIPSSALALRAGNASERGLIRINQAVIHIGQAAFSQMQQGVTHALTGAIHQASRVSSTAPSGTATSNTSWGKLQSKIMAVQTASAIKGELLGFIGAPSAGGMASLLSTSSSTGGAIAGLGAAAAPVAIALAAVLVVVVAGIAAFKILQMSAEKISRKFEEITRFSGAMMFAKATERMAQFNRQMADANRNGVAYAQAQAFATASENARAEVMLHLDSVMADLAAVFYQITTIFWKAMKPLAMFVEFIQKSVGWFTVLLTSLANMTGPMALVLQPLIQLILAQVQAINQNTKPAASAGINNWYTADVRAMTGKNYPIK